MGDIAAEMLEPGALSGRHDDLGVQRKTVVVAAQSAGHGQRTDIAASAEARDGQVAFGGQRGTALDGGGAQQCEQVGLGCGFAVDVVFAQQAALQISQRSERDSRTTPVAADQIETVIQTQNFRVSVAKSSAS